MNYDILNEFIEKALSFAESISYHYEKLKTLECSNLKNEFVYTNVLNDLKRLIDKEDELYYNYVFTNDERNYIVSYICFNYGIDIELNLEKILHDNFKCFDKALRVVAKIDDMYKDDVITDDKYFDVTDAFDHIEFQKKLLNNYYLVLEEIINSYIENEKDFLEVNIHIKYLLPFIKSDIEQIFIQNSGFNDKVFLDYNMYGDYFEISRDTQEQYVQMHLFSRFVEEINNLLDIEDKNYINSANYILVSEIILKSLIIFFDNSLIDAAMADLKEHIINNSKSFINNKKIITNIFNFIENTKKDKCGYYLSLGFHK